MNKINYVIGDATAPEGEGLKIIVHCCNDIGGWGAGFVLALSRRWDKPEKAYRAMSKEDRHLGNVHLVGVEDDIVVANMIGQHGIGNDEQGFAPVRYSAIALALAAIDEAAQKLKDYQQREVSLHCPRFGSDLAGGDWNIIERLIQECTTVPVTIYDLP